MQTSTLKQSREDALQKLKNVQQKYESLNKSLAKQTASYMQEQDFVAHTDERNKTFLPSVSPVS